MMLTELVERGSLEHVLRSEPELPHKLRFGIAADVVSGLARMHKLKFIHRDLRPANILIGLNYNAKITDSRFINAEDSDTRRFMPPEFESGQYDQQLDMFSYGLLLNQLFTGQHEYDGRQVNIVKQALVVGKFVSQCIDFNPDERPKAQFLSDMFHFIRQNVDESTKTSKKEKKRKRDTTQSIVKLIIAQIALNSIKCLKFSLNKQL